MNKLIIPSYNALLSTATRIRAIQELYEYNTKLETDIGNIEKLVPEEASPTNQLADKDYVENHIIGVPASNLYNLASILAIVPYASTITMTSNAEWKLVVTDINSAILLGKRQNNEWVFPMDLDEVLDIVMDDYNNP